LGRQKPNPIRAPGGPGRLHRKFTCGQLDLVPIDGEAQ